MKQKNLIVLAALTVVVVFAAMQARKPGTSAAPAEGSGERFFEGLRDRINDIARIEVSQGGETITAIKSGEEWGIEEVGGYPAEFKPVKEALMAISDLEIVEAKTADPARHAELGVSDPTDAVESSTMVVLKDDAGGVLASFIAGTAKPGRNPKLYARRTGEDQSWLLKGSLNLKSNATAWMDKQIANVTADRVARVTVTHADGEVLDVHKDRPDDANFSVSSIPEGRELTAETIANSMGSALSYLRFEEVRPVGELDLESLPVATAEIRTWEGVVVMARIAEDGDRTWVTFESRYEDPPVPAPLPEDEPEDGVEAEDEGHDDEHDHAGHDHEGDEAEEDDDLPDPEVVKAEILALNEKMTPWAYSFPTWKQSNFTKRMDELLKPPAPVEDEETLDPSTGEFFEALDVPGDDEAGSDSQ